MRLCFLYSDQYAPYSKWFGTAFARLDIDERIKSLICGIIKSDNIRERENNLVEAQLALAKIHNESGFSEKVDVRIENYFGRDIKVIFADKIVDSIQAELKNTPFENIPLVGSYSQHIGYNIHIN